MILLAILYFAFHREVFSQVVEKRKDPITKPTKNITHLKEFNDQKERFLFPKERETLNRQQNSVSGEIYQAWVKHYSRGTGYGIDKATGIAVDNWGNVYVTGISEGSDIEYNIGMNKMVTIKYSPDGQEQWIARFDEQPKNHCEPAGIALDNDGNIYVTGFAGDWDKMGYATIKYTPTGNQQWVAYYFVTENSYNYARAVACDHLGNVYVTGDSYLSSEKHYDYATIKYNSIGEELWVARYNGPVNRADVISALAVDDSGNVYVTGWSNGDGHDYATIKYNNEGEEQWVARYNSGPGDWPVNKDHANDLVIDTCGNVYVTGWSYNSESYPADFATVKYNSEGIEQWVDRFDNFSNGADNAVGIEMDRMGYIYVSGNSKVSTTGTDIYTIKYDSDGSKIWTMRFNGGQAFDDIVTDLAIDDHANVILNGYTWSEDTGWDILTIKYNNEGRKKWVARYHRTENSDDYGYALATDHYGNIYVTGITGTPGQYCTIKYDSLGSEQWVAHYDGPGKPHYNFIDLTMDRCGNVYVTGYFYASHSYDGFVTIKYNSDGVKQWFAQNDNKGWTKAIAVDEQENVYVAGITTGENTGHDYTVVKYNQLGEQQWIAYYNGPANSFDDPCDIAVDKYGNVFVTGRSKSSSTQYDYATVKYNAYGVQQWEARYNKPENPVAIAEARTIAVDSSQNVYITGNIGTIKYSRAGDLDWISETDGIDIVVDEVEHIYVTGKTHTIKYDNTGTELWKVDCRGHKIAVDDSGNVYTIQGGYDYITFKFNKQGEKVWENRYNGSANSSDIAYSLALDKSAGVYVTGLSYGSSHTKDFLTIKYNSNGEEEWIARYDDFNNEARGIAVDDSGNVFVAGTTYEEGPHYDKYWSTITTIKYSSTPTKIKHEFSDRPKAYCIYQNYPNPFNSSTTISFSLQEPTLVTLKVFNLIGQEIDILVDETKSNGKYDIHWEPKDLPSGVYFYRFEARTLENRKRIAYHEIKKMILLK